MLSLSQACASNRARHAAGIYWEDKEPRDPYLSTLVSGLRRRANGSVLASYCNQQVATDRIFVPGGSLDTILNRGRVYFPFSYQVYMASGVYSMPATSFS